MSFPKKLEEKNLNIDHLYFSYTPNTQQSDKTTVPLNMSAKYHDI